MRRSTMASLAVVAALTLGIQGRILADDGANQASPDNAAAPAMQGPNGGQGEGGGRMMAQMKEKLGLSDDQFVKFKQEQKQNRETMKPLDEKRKGLMETLASQVDSKASDSDISATLSSLESVDKDIAGAKADHATALKSILSPSQYAQMVLMMAKSMEGARMRRQDEKANAGDAQGAPPADSGNNGNGNGNNGDNGNNGGNSGNKY